MRLTELLKQPQFEPVQLDEQVMAIFAITKGFGRDVPVAKIREYEAGMLNL
jgi:F-type H+-transporting ATPase subunit alpha